jgi:hypothetical protein
VRLTLLVLLLSGCLLPTLLKEPPQTFYAPPAIYGQWWDATCTCAKATGNVNRIRWATLPDEQNGGFLCERAGAHYPGYCYGVWVEPHTILLSQSQVENEYTVRHEMLHDLLPRLAHTDPRFYSCVGLSANPPTVGAPTL